MDEAGLSCNGFLGGRIALWQPKEGYRAGTDAVFLAAAVPAKAGQSALELGCGAGAAALCLMHRVPGLAVTGVEMQESYAALAKRNASHNALAMEVVLARIEALPPEVAERSFDHVFANPPFFETNSLTAPRDGGKKIAHAHVAGALEDWVGVARRRLKVGGTFTLIHRIEALPALMAACREGFGDLEVFPITSRSVRPAERMVLRARKGRRGPMTLHPPIVMHRGESHDGDGNDYSERAQGILAEARPLC